MEAPRLAYRHHRTPEPPWRENASIIALVLSVRMNTTLWKGMYTPKLRLSTLARGRTKKRHPGGISTGVSGMTGISLCRGSFGRRGEPAAQP